MKLILATDFSTGSDAAIANMKSRLWPPGTSCEAIHVLEVSPDDSKARELELKAQERLKAAALEISTAGVSATPVVLRGDARKVLAARAKETAADWIITGAHSGRGLADYLLGSVPKALLRTAPCSIEIARPPKLASWAGQQFHLLLGTDGSEGAMAAARSVTARPWPENTEVRVLSAVEFHLPFLQASLEPAFLDAEGIERLRAEAMQRAADSVRRAVEVLAAAGLKTSEAESVLVADAKTILIQEAREWNADLIVVGSHGRRGFDRLLQGSVSEAVAMHAPCSVEVVRQPEA
jgi:nucleotide-binding universal stress UspA family protein